MRLEVIFGEDDNTSRLFREDETTPVAELSHGSLAHAAPWNIVGRAANT